MHLLDHWKTSDSLPFKINVMDFLFQILVFKSWFVISGKTHNTLGTYVHYHYGGMLQFFPSLPLSFPQHSYTLKSKVCVQLMWNLTIEHPWFKS